MAQISPARLATAPASASPHAEGLLPSDDAPSAAPPAPARPADAADLERLLSGGPMALYPPRFRPSFELEPPRDQSGAGLGALRAGRPEPRGTDGKTWFIPLGLKSDDASKALVALGVTGLLLAADGPIRDEVQRRRSPDSDRLSSIVEPFGRGYIAPTMAGTYLAGVVFENERARQVAIDGLKAALLSQGLTEGVKAATGRLRPRDSADDPYAFGEGGKSFFSGHSSGASAWWHTVALHLRDTGDPNMRRLAILADVLGAAVPLSRVHDDAHWSSDAFVGWAVGFFTAELIHRRRTGRGSGGLLVAPGVDAEGNFALHVSYAPRRPSRPMRCRKVPEGRARVRACIEEAFARGASS